MKRNVLLALWAVMFALCAGLGLVPEPAGAVKVVGILAGLGFFALGGLCLWQAIRGEDAWAVKLIRTLSLLSLGLTLALLVGNLLSVLGPQWLGDGLYIVLAIVSAPMLCMGHWALSLFFWACLLMVCLTRGSRAKG